MACSCLLFGQLPFVDIPFASVTPSTHSLIASLFELTVQVKKVKVAQLLPHRRDKTSK